MLVLFSVFNFIVFFIIYCAVILRVALLTRLISWFALLLPISLPELLIY